MPQPPLLGSTFFGLDVAKLLERFWMFRRQVSKRYFLLEFNASSLTFAEARFGEAEVQFGHVSRVQLPEGAIERGVPSDPAKMAGLLKDLCREEQIYARRTAVVLPPEAAFTKLVDLPADLTLEEARAFAGNPSSGLQIPIPLQQTDFDLSPTSLPVKQVEGRFYQTYFLTSIPQKLVDQLLETLQDAELELAQIDLAFACQSRLIASDIADLALGDYLLMLELLPDCTHLSVLAASGPVHLERLSAIREFPEPNLSREQSDAALDEVLTAEAITLADDRYLPLSELDLRVLIGEIRQAMGSFLQKVPACRWKGIALSGINSAHPLLSDLFVSAFRMPVHVIKPLGATGVGHVRCSQLLVYQSLGRLLGLGTGLLPKDVLVACSISSYADHHSFGPSTEIPAFISETILPSESLRIAEQLSGSEEEDEVIQGIHQGEQPLPIKASQDDPPALTIPLADATDVLSELPADDITELGLPIGSLPIVQPSASAHPEQLLKAEGIDPGDITIPKSQGPFEHEQWPSIIEKRGLTQQSCDSPESEEAWPSLHLGHSLASQSERHPDLGATSPPLAEPCDPLVESTEDSEHALLHLQVASSVDATEPEGQIVTDAEADHLPSTSPDQPEVANVLTPPSESESWLGELKYSDNTDAAVDQFPKSDPDEFQPEEEWPSITPLLHNTTSKATFPLRKQSEQSAALEPEMYAHLTVAQLKLQCAENQLKSFRTLRKHQLIELLISKLIPPLQ